MIFFDRNGHTITTFEQTPLMPTYLIAFHISDFKYIEEIHDRFKQRIYANPLLYATGSFALTNSQKILESFANYLNVAYSLPKMDQVAVSYFKGGGKFISKRFYITD